MSKSASFASNSRRLFTNERISRIRMRLNFFYFILMIFLFAGFLRYDFSVYDEMWLPKVVYLIISSIANINNTFPNCFSPSVNIVTFRNLLLSVLYFRKLISQQAALAHLLVPRSYAFHFCYHHVTISVTSVTRGFTRSRLFFCR